MRSTSAALFLALTFIGCHRHHRVDGPAPTPTPPPAPVNEQLTVAGAGQALTRVTTDPVDEYRPVLSSDHNLLFVAVTYQVDGAGQKTSTVTQEVLIGTNPENGASRRIFTGGNSMATAPAWMPDSSSFVFMSNSMGSWNLVRSLSKAPNSAVTVVNRGDVAQGLDHPSVSPDGKRVAFQMNANGGIFIGVSGLDGSNFTQLTEGAAPSWSADGKMLAFYRTVGSVQQIFLVDPNTGSNLVQVTNDTSTNMNPCWSPDSRYVVFQSNRGYQRFPSGTADHTWNLYAVKPDGTGMTQLTDGARDSGQAFWGADGWIYFASNNAGNYDIWKLKPGGELATAS